jgi:hypothetical protein
VTFAEVGGMTELNNHKPIRIKNCKVITACDAAAAVGAQAAAAAAAVGTGRGVVPRKQQQAQQKGSSRQQTCARPMGPPHSCWSPFHTCPCPLSCSPSHQAHSFELECDTSGFGAYARGGIVTQHKESKVGPTLNTVKV